MVVPTLVGGTLSENVQNGHYLRLMALPAAPLKVVQGLYPGYTDNGNLSPGAWTLSYAVVLLLSFAVLVWRYRGDET